MGDARRVPPTAHGAVTIVRSARKQADMRCRPACFLQVWQSSDAGPRVGKGRRRRNSPLTVFASSLLRFFDVAVGAWGATVKDVAMGVLLPSRARRATTADRSARR